MESGSLFTPPIAAVAIIIALISVYVAYIWYTGRNTVPAPAYISGFENPLIEMIVDDTIGLSEQDGFYVGNSESPDCLTNSHEAKSLMDIFSSKEHSFEEGPADFRELSQIVGKLTCFKKDLISSSYVVDSTRHQPFITMHDLEPISETTGRCFTKTISPRDLEIAFDKWTTRGEMLIRRLCTEYKLSESNVNKSQELFHSLIRDVKDVARGACLQGDPMIAGKPGPRDPHPFDAPANVEFGEYTGYY